MTALTARRVSFPGQGHAGVVTSQAGAGAAWLAPRSRRPAQPSDERLSVALGHQ